MATVKRHRFFCQSGAALHQVSLVCETACECPCMSSLCVMIQPHLMHCKAFFKMFFMCVDGIDFQRAAVMYVCLDSCFLAGVTKSLCVCVWARSERSHSSPALTYLRLHEAKTASMISFIEARVQPAACTYNDCSHVSIISIPLHQRLETPEWAALYFTVH